MSIIILLFANTVAALPATILPSSDIALCPNASIVSTGPIIIFDTICNAVKNLANCLSRYYKKKVIILLDEYDTPMQEAYINGYWEELANFTRSLFNATFKTNPYLERAIMTGITRVSKESIFSDLNNLDIVSESCIILTSFI